MRVAGIQEYLCDVGLSRYTREYEQMALTPGPFDILRDEHRSLTRLFAHHQESLLERDWERFLLTPSETAAIGLRWADEVYRAEHRRIMLLLERIIERVMRAGRHGVSAPGLIALLDQERSLKHLIEHHHHREEVALFNERRGTLAADTRAALGRALAGATPASAV